MDRLLASDGNTRNFPLTAWANVELSGGSELGQPLP